MRTPTRGTAASVATTIREGRIFALTLAAGFIVVALFAYWKDASTVALAAAALAAISLLAAALVPGKLGPVMRAWMKLGEFLGHITTPILMAIVYYAIVTPIGIIRRVFSRGRDATGDSGWHARPPLPPREKMERQF